MMRRHAMFELQTLSDISQWISERKSLRVNSIHTIPCAALYF